MQKTGLLIRYMTEEDRSSVERLFNETGASLHANFLPSMVDDSEYYVGAFISDEGGERLIGFCTIGSSICTEYERKSVEDCILSDIFVDERERRKGYGSAIVEKAIELIAERYEKDALIYIELLKTDLAKWYDKFGFTPYEITNGEIMSMNRPVGNELIKIQEKETDYGR